MGRHVRANVLRERNYLPVEIATMYANRHKRNLAKPEGQLVVGGMSKIVNVFAQQELI